MTRTTNINQLATELVGDGKRPNKWFVTIAYGWYLPNEEDAEMVQVENSLESSTLLFTKKEDAIEFFNSIPMHTTNKVQSDTIGQVVVEDRLNGVILEKRLTEWKDRYVVEKFS